MSRVILLKEKMKEKLQDCNKCGGDGFIKKTESTPVDPKKYLENTEICPKCNGLGVIPKE